MANLFTFLNFLNEEVHHEIEQQPNQQNKKNVKKSINMNMNVNGIQMQFNGDENANNTIFSIFTFTWFFVAKQDKNEMLFILSDFIRMVLEAFGSNEREIFSFLNLLIKKSLDYKYKYENMDPIEDNEQLVDWLLEREVLISQLFKINIIVINKNGETKSILPYKDLKVIFIQKNKFYVSYSNLQEGDNKKYPDTLTVYNLLDDYSKNVKIEIFHPRDSNIKDTLYLKVDNKLESKEISQITENIYSLLVFGKSLQYGYLDGKNKFEIYINLIKCFLYTFVETFLHTDNRNALKILKLFDYDRGINKGNYEKLAKRFINIFYLTVNSYYTMNLKDLKSFNDDNNSIITTIQNCGYNIEIVKEDDKNNLVEFSKSLPVNTFIYEENSKKLFLKIDIFNTRFAYG